MKTICTIGRALSTAMLAGWIFLAGCGTALAAAGERGGEEKPDPSSVYSLPYALVILAVILGLLVVLRASNRREREKPEEYESQGLSVEDE